MGKGLGRLAAATALVALASAALAQQVPSNAPWRNPALPTAQRVDALIAQMTIEEKASQLVNVARAIPRLGVPAYNWWSEALHGVARNGFATVFPEPIGLAATFDPATIQQMGHAIGVEGRVKWNQIERAGGEHRIMQGLTYWSPNINIFRDPRWGRGQETYGEDPYLTAHMGSAFVRGMQGDDPKYYLVSATAKHYAVHSGPEPGRHSDDIKVSLHDMEDTYLPAFRALVVDAKVESVMCAYNAINGQPACANQFLMQDRLRDAWQFKGHQVSDCDAIADIERGHHYTKTYAEAAAVSLKLGVDNDCAEFGRATGSTADYDRYTEAMKSGLVAQAVVDESLRRLFTGRMRLGMFDPKAMVPFNAIPDSELNSPAHQALALKLARESMVLLKNDGVLPMRPVKRIAVVGPLADQVDVLAGNYNGAPVNPVSVLAGLRAQFPRAEIVFEPGTAFLRNAEPVPAAAFSTDDGKPGITGQFWSSATIAGAPALTRIDPAVSFDINSPRPLTEAAAISARWNGFITPSEGGPWQIGVTGRGTKLYLDGKLIVENSDPRLRGANVIDIQLERGRRYAVRIEQEGITRGMPRLVWNRVVADPLGRAVAAAHSADLVIAVAGITSALEGEEMTVNVPGFKGGDRTSLDLPAPEQEVLEAVKATGKPLVLVLMNGSALSVNWAAANADAILEAWYPGQAGGTAVAETLAGANNPSGRLPVTFYKSVDQLPPFGDYAMTNRTYRYFTGQPLWPFGYGLSYTRFAYGKVALSQPTVKAGAPLGVDVEVRNTGKVPGDEVAQLYLSFPNRPGAPLRALRGFSRVHLAPGEARKVHFDLSPRDLSMVTDAGARVVAPGAYRLSVGGGQPGTGAPTTAATFRVDGNYALPL